MERKIALLLLSALLAFALTACGQTASEPDVLPDVPQVGADTFHIQTVNVYPES